MSSAVRLLWVPPGNPLQTTQRKSENENFPPGSQQTWGGHSRQIGLRQNIPGPEQERTRITNDDVFE